MSLKSWWQGRKVRRGVRSSSAEHAKPSPLREFVYLDAVSLHSLLVSQNSTIPENVSEAITRAEEAELRSSLTADALVGKGEIAARYQTSNSNNVQSSRKAIIQTLFKELRDLPLDFKLAAPEEDPSPAKDVDALVAAGQSEPIRKTADFVRGDLVEIEVTLSVDPVFKLGAMMTEWTAMADDYPGMFGSSGVLGFLREAQPIMKVLDRFLAGLIPIRATATKHVVIEVQGQEYIVHQSFVEGLGLKSRPLQVVGVTERLGYWRDLRRVLFSGARFTMLCRVARDGIHTKWTPVKLADLFSEVAPGFADQINAIKSPIAADTGFVSPESIHQVALSAALIEYKNELVVEGDTAWTSEVDAEFSALVKRLQGGSVSASAQRLAFDEVRAFIVERLDVEPDDSDGDLAARQRARTKASLELFPSLIVDFSAETTKPTKGKPSEEDRLLDVEVIAIYW